MGNDTLGRDANASDGALDRRRFMGACSAAGLSGTLFPGVLWARIQEEAPESPITSAMIAEAEKIAGLELTDEERELMRRGLGRNLDSYAALRELKIPNDVPPSLVFEPAMPGVETASVLSTSSPSSDRSAPLRVSGAAAPPVGGVPSGDDLAFLPVTSLSSLVRDRKVSSTELTQLYLGRLRRYEPKLKFLVTLTEELALKQAHRADQEIAAGNYRGPLHGIPWGAKDLLATRDYPTTWGAAPYRDQTIHQDATVVQRLEAAGAVLVGKLTLGALAQGDYWFGGRTRNPWKIDQGSSGSSAGPGSATAAGCVGFGIGTETRGSIVSPSTRNGVTGLRPTFGRVSRNGAMALSWSMDKIGPMCRSAEDCALIFSAIHGADGLDPSARDVPFGWDPYRPLDDLRIGFLESAFEEGESYENRADDLETLRVLRDDLGLDLVPVALPDFPVDAIGFMLVAESAAAFDELTRSNRDDELTRQTRGAWPTTFRTARMIPAVEYIQASRARTMYMRLFSEAIRDVDVFVAPSFHGGLVGATNLTGHPCVVVPNGFTDEGTPVSVSFIGGLYRDADALRLAHAYQAATDWHLRRPDGDSQELPTETTGE